MKSCPVLTTGCGIESLHAAVAGKVHHDSQCTHTCINYTSLIPPHTHSYSSTRNLYECTMCILYHCTQRTTRTQHTQHTRKHTQHTQHTRNTLTYTPMHLTHTHTHYTHTYMYTHQSQVQSVKPSRSTMSISMSSCATSGPASQSPAHSARRR